VVVAVLDTSVRFERGPACRGSGGKLLPGYDFVSSDGGNSFKIANDGDGWDQTHQTGRFRLLDLASAPFRILIAVAKPTAAGTARVSGMVAADTDNAISIAGTGFNVRVLPVRVLGKCGATTPTDRWHVLGGGNARAACVLGGPVPPATPTLRGSSTWSRGSACSSVMQPP
jgi:serine protease